jgi:TfoX/Sxy family transcriptional regulator of competence genes
MARKPAAKPSAKPASGPWRKSPPELIAAFKDALPLDPRVEPRQMFGYPCAFVGGNMFTGMHQESLIVRLSESDRAEAISRHGASTFEPMPGRPMREYVALPARIVASPKDLAAWMARALDYAGGLPPKVKKAEAKPAARGRSK